MRKKIMAMIVAIVIVISEMYFMSLEAVAGDALCMASGCNNSRTSGSYYCYTHACRHISVTASATEIKREPLRAVSR